MHEEIITNLANRIKSDNCFSDASQVFPILIADIANGYPYKQVLVRCLCAEILQSNSTLYFLFEELGEFLEKSNLRKYQQISILSNLADQLDS